MMAGLLGAALPWIKSNWRNIGLGAGAIFMILFLRQCGQLSACRSAEADAVAKASTLVEQKQDLEGKLASKSTAKARVVYVNVPGQPCPEVRVDLEASGDTAAEGRGSQAQSASATAQVAPVTPNWSPRWGVTLGGGREVYAGEAWNGKLALNYGDISVGADLNTDGQARAEAAYTHWFK